MQNVARSLRSELKVRVQNGRAKIIFLCAGSDLNACNQIRGSFPFDFAQGRDGDGKQENKWAAEQALILLLGDFHAGFFDDGEEEGEDGAVVDRVFGAAVGETAIMVVNDACRDPEAEAGTV